MNAKIFRDGERVLISFEGMTDAEEFLERVVDIISGALEEKVVPQEIVDLEPAIEEDAFDQVFEAPTEAETVKPEITDFEIPYSGKTPAEIMAIPNYEGFYFLCGAVISGKVPPHMREECDARISKLVKDKLLTPPYGDPKRLGAYVKMAQRIFGKETIPDTNINLKDNELEECCKNISELLQQFAEDISKY